MKIFQLYFTASYIIENFSILIKNLLYLIMNLARSKFFYDLVIYFNIRTNIYASVVKTIIPKKYKTDKIMRVSTLPQRIHITLQRFLMHLAGYQIWLIVNHKITLSKHVETIPVWIGRVRVQFWTSFTQGHFLSILKLFKK